MPEMMADLAEANYEKGCFENVGVPFCMTIEAEVYGGSGDYWVVRFMSRM